jgi:hypothetical protein
MLLAHLHTPTTPLARRVGYPSCPIVRVPEISSIQSFIDRYVAKFAILSCTATVRFSPDKADHANVLDYDGEAAG